MSLVDGEMGEVMVMLFELVCMDGVCMEGVNEGKDGVLVGMLNIGVLEGMVNIGVLVGMVNIVVSSGPVVFKISRLMLCYHYELYLLELGLDLFEKKLLVFVDK